MNSRYNYFPMMVPMVLYCIVLYTIQYNTMVCIKCTTVNLALLNSLIHVAKSFLRICQSLSSSRKTGCLKTCVEMTTSILSLIADPEWSNLVCQQVKEYYIQPYSLHNYQNKATVAVLESHATTH
jgi:hypothetical protein